MRKPLLLCLNGILLVLCLLTPHLLSAANPFLIVTAKSDSCDNATHGGMIAGDEVGCPDPVFDPSIITNVQLPSGGTGDLEYMWIYTSDDPSLPVSAWTPIPNSDAPDYDPGPITVTTWYRRCARRSGCDDFIAESNIVVKEVLCCINFNEGGVIGHDQEACGPFQPDTIFNVQSPSGGEGDSLYFWYSSTAGPPFDTATWTLIVGADTLIYVPDTLTQTTWFIRFAIREHCSDSLPSNIVKISVLPPPDIQGEVTHIDCHGNETGSIQLTVDGGTDPYTFEWNLAPPVQNPSDLPAGNYSVTVTDANECTATASFEITEPPLLTVLLTPEHPSCPNGNDGSIVAAVEGGTLPYTFAWSNGSTNQDQDNLTAGTYSLTITDANGCTAVAEVTLVAPPDIVISGEVIQPDCVGETSGSIELTVTGGTPGFSYLWNTGATDPEISDLGAGTYTVTVTDANGCTASMSFMLTDPSGITLTTSQTNVSCPDGSDGSASVDVAGGTAPYSYSWNTTPPQSTPSIENLAAGTYLVTVTDATGCAAIAAVNITQPNAFTISTLKQDVTCFGGDDGVAAVSVTGGTLPYTYLWNTTPPATTSSITNLTAGVYSVTVTDANDCTASTSITIDQPDELAATITKTDVSCPGGIDGTASVAVSGGTAPYTFMWNTSPPQLTPEIGNLVAGTYTVTVTDDNGCSAIASVTINQPPALELATSHTDVSCPGGDDGTAAVTVSGGTAPYSYLWNTTPPQSTSSISNLTAGTYTVTVTDDNGCTETASVIINQLPGMSLSTSKTDVSCPGGSDGTASVMVTGGNAPYSYLWNTTPPQSASSISNLAAGTYSVTVTDDSGCTAVASVIVNQPNNLSISTLKQDVSCFGGDDGIAAVSVTGGTLPYTYLWNTTPPATTSSITNLMAGTYLVTVTDNNGCTATTSIPITEPEELTLTIATTDVSCPGELDGTAAVSVTGGTAPYSYLWNTTPPQTTPTLENLAPGTYSVTVTDDHGCTASSSSTINQPPGLSLTTSITDMTCPGANDGTATVNVTGGAAPYSYLWNTTPPLSTSTVVNLAAGMYSVTVTDDNGCTATASVVIQQPPGLQLTFSITDETCIDEGDGILTVTVSGGTPPYSYLWDDPTGSTTATISNLAPGTYSVTVTDNNGCTATGSATIQAGEEPCDCRVKIGDFVWYDFNKNGLQDQNELGINGVPVYLVEAGPDGEYGTADDIIVQSTVTSGFGQNTGFYCFENVCEGTYAVCWIIDSALYRFTSPKVGPNREIDSDANLHNGCSDPIVITKDSEDDLTIDAGLIDYCPEMTHPGLIGYDEEICYPGDTPSEIVEIFPPSHEPADLEYLWMYTTDEVFFFPGGATWFEVPNSNSKNYQPGPLDQTTWFVRCIRPVGCTDWWETNIVKKTVINPDPSILGAPMDPLCINTNYIIRAVDNGPGATYYWEFGPDATPATANTRIVNNVNWPTAGTKTITLTVTKKGCTKTQTYTYDAVQCFCRPIIQSLDAIMTDSVRVDITWSFDAWSEDHVFVVERSRDGALFEYVHTEDGEARVEKTYRHSDRFPHMGESYYRVTMHDLAGNVEYSTIERVVLRAMDQSNVFVYPNPVSELLTIQFLESMAEESEIHFFDAVGKLIHIERLAAGVRQANVHVGNWMPGSVVGYVYQPGRRPYAIHITVVR